LLITSGEGLPADQKNRLVAKCKPTDEPVQVITLEKKTWTRFVTLMLNRKKSILSFREVEVYNGPLIGKILGKEKQLKRKRKTPLIRQFIFQMLQYWDQIQSSCGAI